MTSVDDKVKAVDDKVAVVIHGAQQSLNSRQGNMFNSALTLVCRIKHPRRESNTTGPSEMDRSIGSVYYPRHCMWCPSQSNPMVRF